ncbi:F-box/FBD/LRR-repeat protein At5g53840, partial [Linum grandiflorum]
SASEPKDRISNLPDEIIHEIFAGLGSTKQPAQLRILSKRWSHLWLAYPVFDFNRREWPIEMRKENLKKFLTAAGTKFSYLQHATAIRIELFDLFKSDLLDEILSFVSTVTQEVRLDSTYCGCIVLPRGLFNDDRLDSTHLGVGFASLKLLVSSFFFVFVSATCWVVVAGFF